MIVTEKDAKKKWCPMVRYAQTASDENSSNRWEASDSDEVIENPDRCRCIASECAMWRWAVFEKQERPATTMLNSNPHAQQEVVAESPEPRGYCGLAGLPVVIR